MKVNIKRVMELGVNDKLQKVFSQFTQTTLLFIMGIVEYPEIGQHVYLLGQEDETSEAVIKDIDYVSGRAYVEYKRRNTSWQNADGKVIGWHKDGYDIEVVNWDSEASWYDMSSIKY